MPTVSYLPSKRTLGEILGSTSPPIRVPDYQRDYSWQVKHVSDFWKDLSDFDKKYPDNQYKTKEYFLGSSVMVDTSDYHLLLDGQQRLATATILLSAIRDRLQPINKAAADQIQSNFIVSEDHLNGGAKRYKLELNIFDRDFFRSAVQDREPNEKTPVKRSHRLILGARKFFDDKIEDLWQQHAKAAESTKRLIRLASILTEHFGLVVVSSSDPDHAASIFETLNDRGIGLSTADLLRSWLLTEASDQARGEMIRRWTEIFKSAKQEKPEVVIRASWVSRHGDVKARSMYKEIKYSLQANAVPVLQYTRELNADANTYRALVRSATGNPVVDEVCRGLAKLKAAGCFATLIAATNKETDTATVARALASLTIRHNVVCQLDPTKLEAKAFEAAKQISEGKQLSEVLTTLRQLSPTDAAFRTSFESLKFSRQKHRTVQILLRTIENNRVNTGEKIIADPKSVHIEHIYPENPQEGQKWKEHDENLFRLGNLTLLSAKLNVELKNAPFKEKREIYNRSAFLITQELAKCGTWSASSITTRQSQLCDDAINIWPEGLADDPQSTPPARNKVKSKK